MIKLDGNSLTLEKLRSIVDQGEPVALCDKARAKMEKARAVVEKAAQAGEKIYSINTGFGILSKIRVNDDQLLELQENFIRSHCVAVGEPHSERESRAMLVLRANVLAKGMSGVRPGLVDLLVGMLNKKVHPVIPSRGSVGCSGDLAPLSHLAAVLIGEGHAYFQGEKYAGREALKRAGLSPVTLGIKEGLSLVNGTQQMTALGASLLWDAEALVEVADLICSTSLEGILGTPRAFQDWIHEARPYPGQQLSAKRLSSYLENSEIYASHLNCDRVQDPYSLRCAPQVHGATRDLFAFARQTFSTELNAATDNPLVNAETGEIVSGGNFHGQPLAYALDILGMGIAELANISERRTAKLINPVFSELPAFLVKQEGLNSGFMIAQYTAAHFVVENRILSHPASTDSVSTNNDKEDHNSMGPVAAFKAAKILDNASYVLAIEALAACQALEFRKPLRPGRGPQVLLDFVREKVPVLERDRYLNEDIEWMKVMIRQGKLVERMKQKSLLTE